MNVMMVNNDNRITNCIIKITYLKNNFPANYRALSSLIQGRSFAVFSLPRKSSSPV